ncbi:hypothetical protein BLNAU_14539 [Blattamonas nauphoetae]|uniref:PPPDE domain-containing protein n=1 Tax=Blattamonas nauphoetae TaxID=2049346 RepID=A0ABQ9XK69_9EUKA|nr:hypothetical protein BLNAU_14539 [Blattamonas nauphoetae]
MSEHWVGSKISVLEEDDGPAPVVQWQHVTIKMLRFIVRFHAGACFKPSHCRDKTVVSMGVTNSSAFGGPDVQSQEGSDGDYLNPEAAGLTVDFNPEGIGFFHRSFTSCSEEAGTVVGQKYGRPGLNYTAIRHWLVGHQDEYSAETYSLVNHNCQHFARHFYNFLTKINEDDPDDPVVITHTRGVIDALKNVGLFVFGMATVGVAFVIGSAVNAIRSIQLKESFFFHLQRPHLHSSM